MGWTSTGDPYANVGDAGLSFDSEEAARAFAEKHGWDYVVRFLYRSFNPSYSYPKRGYLFFIVLRYFYILLFLRTYLNILQIDLTSSF